MMNSSDRHIKGAATIICVAAAVFSGYLILRYALPFLLPFVIARCTALFVAPVTDRLNRATHIPRAFWTAVILLTFSALVGVAVAYIFNMLAHEISRLSAEVDGNGIGNGIDRFFMYIEGLTEKLPIIRDIRSSSPSSQIWESLDTVLKDGIVSFLKRLTVSFSEHTGSFISSAPKLLMGVTVTVIAAFCYCSGKPDTGIYKFLPENTRNRLRGFSEKLKIAAKAWFRAFFLILCLTFSELFVGFMIIGIRYPLLVALGIALLDILPVFGSGVVLIPWSLFSYYCNDARRGTGLIILYAVILIVRQIAEPKIVGKCLGVPPLLTIAAMYAGLCFFGVGGMIAAPPAVLIIRTVISDRKS